MIKPAKFLFPLLLFSILDRSGLDHRPMTSYYTSPVSTASPRHRSAPQEAYILGPMVSAEIESMTVPRDHQTKGKLQIGARRPIQPSIAVNGGTVPASAWSLQNDGSLTWSAEIASPGGLGIRVHLEKVVLPDGASIAVFHNGAQQQSFTITSNDLSPQRDVWTSTVFGDQVVIQCRVPADANTSAISFSINEISHLYVLPNLNANLKEGDCHNDVTCYPDWSNEATAVARISFIEHGNAFLCSGCLLSANIQTSDQ